MKLTRSGTFNLLNLHIATVAVLAILALALLARNHQLAVAALS